MRKLAYSVVLLVGLAGCQTTDQMEATAATDMNSSYVGYPLYDYISRNNAAPVDAFDMPGDRRVFVFGSPCFSWWHTKRVGPKGSPASYIVERIEIRGYCRTR